MNETRTAAIVTDIVASLRDVIRHHRVTYDEYRAAVRFLDEAAHAGEFGLMADVLLEATVEQAGAHSDGGTDSDVEGPFYLDGAPLLDSGVLPMRPDEPGTPLTFTGAVRTTEGHPVPDAELDIWQADSEGRYSGFDAGVPDGNLRGRVRCAGDGTFAVRTVVPAAYDLPTMPYLARVVEQLGSGVHRPAHIHCRIRSARHPQFTTQVYFVGDPYLHEDAVGAAKDSLAVKLEPDADDPGALVCRFDVVLAG